MNINDYKSIFDKQGIEINESAVDNYFISKERMVNKIIPKTKSQMEMINYGRFKGGIIPIPNTNKVTCYRLVFENTSNEIKQIIEVVIEAEIKPILEFFGVDYKWKYSPEFTIEIERYFLTKRDEDPGFSTGIEIIDKVFQLPEDENYNNEDDDMYGGGLDDPYAKITGFAEEDCIEDFD
jgi:hypothetical protein